MPSYSQDPTEHKIVKVPFARLISVFNEEGVIVDRRQHVRGDDHAVIDTRTASMTIPHLHTVFVDPVIRRNMDFYTLKPGEFQAYIENGQPVKVFISRTGNGIIYLRVPQDGIVIIALKLSSCD